MPTPPRVPDALREILRQLKKTREEARDLVFTARLVREVAQKIRQQTQDLRRALWEQIQLAHSLCRHTPVPAVLPAGRNPVRAIRPATAARGSGGTRSGHRAAQPRAQKRRAVKESIPEQQKNNGQSRDTAGEKVGVNGKTD